MDPILLAQLRKNWQVACAGAIFLVFLFVHFFVLTPTAHRYQSKLKQATSIGLALDPGATPRLIPPRVVAFLTDNALSPAEAQERGDSGGLTSALLEVLSRTSNRHGMQIVATEPGPTTQEPQAVLVRAHLRIQCSYPEFLGFLEDLNSGGDLIAVDRFSFQGGGARRHLLEIWVTRYMLKQSGGHS